MMALDECENCPGLICVVSYVFFFATFSIVTRSVFSATGSGD